MEFLNEITPDIKYEKAFKAIVLDIWQSNYKITDEANEVHHKEVKKLEAERQRVFDSHRMGLYSNSEFLQQKDRINRQISHHLAHTQEIRKDEMDMEEALSYCFDFVLNTAERWEVLTHPHKLRFQKLIFDGNVAYNGEKLGALLILAIRPCEGVARAVPLFGGRKRSSPQLRPPPRICNWSIQHITSFPFLLPFVACSYRPSGSLLAQPPSSFSIQIM
jgi:hypothetical protein